MKKVRYSVEVELQLEESIDQLVERGYFSEEDYAVNYIRDLVTYFQLNLDHLTAFDAPDYFARYGSNLKYALYRKSSRTTWYAFFKETPEALIIVYLGNNHLIGHHLDLEL
jgi:hypothetical protein